MRQLLMPLQIVGGGFAYTEDFGRILKQRVIAALGTQTGERVMRPDLGVDYLGIQFEPSMQASQDLVRAVSEALHLVPEAEIREISAQPGTETGSVILQVRYSQRNGVEDSVSIPIPTRST